MDSRRPYLKNKRKGVYRECAGGRKTGFREQRGGGHAQEEEQVQQLTAAAGLAGRCRQVQPLLPSALQVTAGDALHLPPPAGWGGGGVLVFSRWFADGGNRSPHLTAVVWFPGNQKPWKRKEGRGTKLPLCFGTQATVVSLSRGRCHQLGCHRPHGQVQAVTHDLGHCFATAPVRFPKLT